MQFRIPVYSGAISSHCLSVESLGYDFRSFLSIVSIVSLFCALVNTASKTAAAAAGIPEFHFHSLRHTHAVNAIRAGDDTKTVQGNLGHASAAFTLDRYGHVAERMKRDSAQRMEHFIKDVMNL